MKVSRVLLTCLSLALVSAQAFAGKTASFAKVVDYSSGANGANSVVATDVNQDGLPDIVVATNNGVSVLLNNGDGTFAQSTTYSTGGTFSEAVAIADVNNDGNPDIVVTNMCLDPTNCSGVGVLLGKGDGTFQSAVGYASGGLETGGVAVADVNRDGWPDLVLTSNCQLFTCAGGTLTLLLNKGDGTFARAIDLSDAKGPVAVGDMNNDGIPDLVTGAGLMLGNGDGTFQPADSQVVGGANSIVLADVNQDGNLDVISTIPTAVAVQLGNGDGTIQSDKTYQSGGLNPLWVVVADFNGDNRVDLAVANECTKIVNGVCTGGATVGVLAGSGDGTFKKAAIFGTGGYFGTSVAAADADGDGKLDLFASNACTTPATCNPGSVGVLINNFVTSTITKNASSLNPVGVGQPVTFTATVSWSDGLVPDGDTVSFFDGSTQIGSGTIKNGAAAFTTSSLSAGIHLIKASFDGDTYFNPSSNTVRQLVNAYPTSTALSSSPNPSKHGQVVVLTAVVTSSGGNIPTGNVLFKNGAASIGIGTLDSTGTATLQTSKLPLGSDQITANYQGDSQDAKSTSPVLPQTVN